MCTLIVECFFIGPLLRGLSAKPLVGNELLTRDAFNLSSQADRLGLYLYSMRQRIITF